MSRSRCLAVLALALCVCNGLAQQSACTDREARRAETEADSLRSWDDLYRSYKLYRECDDAAIAEGYSESVARILVDHWRTLSRLARLASRDADFRHFVIRHIDDTLATEDVKKIRANADKRCPTSSRDLCHDLRKQAE